MEENTVSEPFFESKREQYLVFFLVFMGVITLTYGVLYAVDFIPEKPSENMETEEAQVIETTSILESVQFSVSSFLDTFGNTSEETAVPEPDIADQPSESADEPEPERHETEVAQVDAVNAKPLSIIFDSLEKEIQVLNPESRDIASLDHALLSGVVRHPDSADFADEGTIFLFGHSSYLPNVINKNFQAFNGIQNLEWGDTVRLQSNDREYVYRVDRVYQAKASDAEVTIERGEAKLTLATCNTFGSKDDRYIVEATLIRSGELGAV